jgi:phosphoribosylanthranilate isomerase
MTRTRVKICGITRAEDALAAARAGADAIGLVLWAGSPRNVAFEQARAIAATVPPFVSIVGLFVDPDPEHVREALAKIPLGFLQFHGAEPPHFCRSFGLRYLKAVPVAGNATRTDLLEYAARYSDACGLLFDAPPFDGLPGGTGQTFDWDALPRSLARPLILSGGLTAANVGEAIRRLSPWGVDVSSGVEASAADGRTQRGTKDPARIAAFIEEVRNADD